MGWNNQHRNTMNSEETMTSAETLEGESRLSRLLQRILHCEKDSSITLGELMQRMEERGFGLMLMLLAIVAWIPVFPPGASGVVGMLCIIGALQMAWGRRVPWLPARLQAYVLSEKVIRLLREHGVRLLRGVEKLSRPRWAPFGEKVLLRLASVVVLLMGIVMFLPLPFMNSLPALSVMAVALGLLNRDGLFLAAGAVLAGLVLSVVGASVKTVWNFILWAYHEVFSTLWHFQNCLPI